MRLADYDTPGLVTGNTATLSLLGKDQSLPTAGIAAALEKVFDGFYTLVVTTADSMAVVRDPIACKPAIIAETKDYVAMASECRALASLPASKPPTSLNRNPERATHGRSDSPRNHSPRSRSVRGCHCDRSGRRPGACPQPGSA
jgi:asparagine synthetase B (glutamine-hydrolysing)